MTGPRIVAEPCPECGHPLDEHADSGWGERTVCTVTLPDPDAGWHGVCPCVLRESACAETVGDSA